MENPKFFDVLNDIVKDGNLSEHDKNVAMSNLARMKETKVNLLITGATGAGKSSTINALFSSEKAKVGTGSEPETMDIKKFELNNVILWDSPGLGDSPEKDLQHSKGIISKLLEKDNKGELLIDLVLVILDGSSRDLGTSYELINKVIIPNLGDDHSRLLIAINQADVAMKGRGWDSDENKPKPELVRFLDEKVQSVRNRIKDATGVDVTPIYYSAGYKYENEEQQPYNLSKLLYFILQNTKEKKRNVFAEDINKNPNIWAVNDNLRNYQEENKKSFIESALKALGEGIGKAIENIAKPITTAIETVSNVVRSVGSFISNFF